MLRTFAPRRSREEPSPAAGGGESSAAPPSSVPTEGGDQIPGGDADAVSDMYKVLEVDYILKHQLDPLQGPSRPYGLREGWHVFNGSRKLACGWSSPPHVAGGKRIACFKDIEPTVRLGVVREVYHSMLFTTVLLELTMAAIPHANGMKLVYVNVWTSRLRSGFMRGFDFCRCRHLVNYMRTKGDGVPEECA